MSPMRQAELELEDGARIELRSIEASDKHALEAGFEQLSAESRYRRFFAPLDRLSGSDLRYLTEVDHHDHEAIIAFDTATREPIAVARYVRSDEPGEAEVAVTVVDAWQGRGVATATLEALVDRAREEGIERFVAVVLSENDAALELFRRLTGSGAEERPGHGAYRELVIELPPAGGMRGSALGDALRTAADGKVLINPWRLLKRRLAGEEPRAERAGAD